MSNVLRDLQVTHTRRSPVYVIGYPRSGTSVTCKLLRRYLKVSFGTESQFIVRYHKRLSSYGNLDEDSNLRRLIKDISSERFFTRSQRNWGFVFDPTKAFSDVAERTYSGVLHAIFHQLAEHNGMVRWGDKTPEYNNDLVLLRRLFPDAQFIHIVRDGRDVALSIHKIHFGPKNAYETARQWGRALGAIRSFVSELPPDQFFELKYEDLTAQPAETMIALAAFLGIDDRSGALRDHVRRSISSDIKQENSKKWRHLLPTSEIERFEAEAGSELARFGYELVFGNAARPVSPPERLYWSMRGHTSRALNVEHWADNLYKLRLRLRTLDPNVVRRTAIRFRTVLGKRQRMNDPVSATNEQ